MARAPRRGRSGADIQTLIVGARDGRYPPVALLTGSERFLVERAVRMLKEACLGDGPGGFNDDLFHGNQGFKSAVVVAAARTLPMMASARFVLARGVDHAPTSELDGLVAYLEAPVDSACLVLTATKLDKRTKLAKAALKAGVLYDAAPLKGGAIRRFALEEAKRRGHRLVGPAAEALVDAVGDDLAGLDDAVERLSLFVGEGKPIEVTDVEGCISRVETESIWTLVDAVGMRKTALALGATGSLLAQREPALRILAMVARQLRMVAGMKAALAQGMDDRSAATAAGAPPFKAREMARAAGRFTDPQLQHAFSVLAEADLALKGSKRPSERVLEEAILRLCAGEPAIRERIPRKVRTYR